MDETATRLDALATYDILDTPPEPEFDDVVQIAQRACGTPIALVSFVVDDRQWFKARVGLEACETSINQSVCAHALKVEDLLVVPDLSVDPRTKDNTLVTAPPHLRFYAGAVLRTPEGVALGSLCVIDTKPRPGGLTHDQAETLKALARQVMVIMSFRRAMTDRERALTVERSEGIRQSEAQKAGGIGTFEIDVATDRCKVSAEFCRIFGLPPRREYTADEIQANILDRRQVTTHLTRSEGTAAPNVEFRIRRAKDGAVRWISRRAEFRTDADGHVQTMVGVVLDVTDRKLVERRAEALVRLGDILRDAETKGDVIAAAAKILGETLEVSRAGYATIDILADSFKVERDWTAQSIASMEGTFSIAHFRVAIDRLRQGVPLSIANVPATLWIAADAPAMADADIKAMIDVPLLRNRELVGVLFVHNATPRTWTPAENDFALAVADRTYATIARIEAEEHQRVLNNELSHRLKNTLAMVQAIVTQTLRGVTEREVVAALEDRIIALGKAHEVLLQETWTSARIETVIAQVLGPHGSDARVRTKGANLTLGPKATLSLSLLLHELATNALKYGALSVEHGRVDLTWRVEARGKEPNFILTWGETGGPAAMTPKRKGFGSRLIGMGIAGAGHAKLDYAATGLQAEFSAPLRMVTEQ